MTSNDPSNDPNNDPHAWARTTLARLNCGPVRADAMPRGDVEILTDDPARIAALRAAIETSNAGLPSIARDLAELAARVRDAAEVLTAASRASAEGRNGAREDLIRKAREELRAILADENFAPEVSQ